MYTKIKFYEGRDTEILYAEQGYVLKHKITHKQYGSVSLKDGRTQDDYIEVPEPQEEQE